jgi:siroheme synthase
VTHRGISSGFLVVGGHDERAFEAAIGGVAPNRITIVVMMGVSRRTALAAHLISGGWACSTPTAIVVDASKPTQMFWRGTLEDLALDRADIENKGPGTIVIGEVVALSTQAAATDEIQGRATSRA